MGVTYTYMTSHTGYFVCDEPCVSVRWSSLDQTAEVPSLSRAPGTYPSELRVDPRQTAEELLSAVLTAVLREGRTVGEAVEGSLVTLSIGDPLADQIRSSLELVQALEIEIRGVGEVFDYLISHPDLVPVIGEITQVIRRELPDAQLVLTVYRDPDQEAAHLVIYARFAEYDASVRGRIRETRKRYRNLLVGKRGWLLLTTDYKSMA